MDLILSDDSVSPVARGSVTIIVRHVVAAVMLAIAWKQLAEWYLYQGAADYLVFVVLFVLAFSVLLFRWRRPAGERIPAVRLIVIAAVTVLALPWGEWLQLNFPSSRRMWSAQLFVHSIAIYSGLFLLGSLKSLVARASAGLKDGLELLARSPKFLWCIPLLFFLVSSWISVFVFRQVPLVQDSAAHLFQSEIFQQGRIVAPAPPLPEFFSTTGDMLVVTENRWFSIYLPGFSLILAVAGIAGAKWLLCPLLGSVVVAIWIFYARRWHSSEIALVFGVLLALSPFILLMHSTVMIHSVELFVASALIYIARRNVEDPKWYDFVLVFLVLTVGVISRGFSLLPFLAPVLVYTSWKNIVRRKWMFPLAAIAAVVAGAGVVAFYQWIATGHPAVLGYALEYDLPIRYGFGPAIVGVTHTPLRGLENVSNQFLGIDWYLTGWHCGSLFFLMAFLLVGKFDTWDRLFGISIAILVLFYYFYFIQDLIIGPRFYFIAAPILLLCIARLFFVESNGLLNGDALRLMIVCAILLYIPLRLPEFISRYVPSGSQLMSFREHLASLNNGKTLIFLDPETQQNLVAWNQPFLTGPWIIARDLGASNEKLQRLYPHYSPAYFRLKIAFGKGELKGGYGIFREIDPNPEGFLSLFAVGMTIQAASQHADRDFFDIAYTDLFRTRNADVQLSYIRQTIAATRNHNAYYKEQFRKALIASAQFLLLPKVAFERYGAQWEKHFDSGQFRRYFDAAEYHFRNAGPVAYDILAQMERVKLRVDRNRDGIRTDQELIRYLKKKTALLYLQ